MKVALVALAFSIAGTMAQAEIVNYDCELHSMEAQGWIPPRVLLSVDADNKRARAYDGAIASYNEYKGWSDEKPMDTKFKVNRKDQYQMQWKVTLSTSTTQKLRVSYMARLDPKINKFDMTARFPMVDVVNRPSGVGRCKPVPSPNLY
ncbi:hypothetical protein [Ruegeria lacuscaerulensis]|uniref:hypothetical protein n=1 Tax=Ruegeria lacuscaerulensis TaxID=55218 RepID=UPI00148130DB|nr:hypothetical protein [Ruegeria lacuscaerulensis]